MSKQTWALARAEQARRAGLRNWGLYLLSLSAWVTAVISLALLGYLVCSRIVWREGVLYALLAGVRDNILLVCLVLVLGGWAVISYLFIGRSAQNTAWLLAGAGELAHPTPEPIRLPEDLRDAENQLNLVREQALRSAQAAKEAEQRKNDLVVYLAHDLRTPLTSVIGYLTLLQTEPQLPEEARERYTGIALEKAQRLEDLINEFFDITRFSLTHLELEREDTDLKRMLEQMCSEFEPTLARREIRCVLELPGELRAVCDREKMARVFDNLLNNACHYAYPQSLLHVAAEQREDRVVITFCNAGPTIAPEKLSRMFEQFFRLDPSRSTREGNAGLGLAIAREIVEAHGGSITARSEQEKVLFTVTLPR